MTPPVPIRVVIVADETEQLQALVARLIQDKLGQEGGFEDLLRAVREVEESFPARDESGNEGGEPMRVDTPFAGEGTLKGEVNAVVVPTMKAVATLLPPEAVVVPDKAVDAIRSAIPELADEIQARSPKDAAQVINLFAALVQLLTALVALYVAQHPAAPVTPQQVIQIFDQSRHVVNQTIVVNPPPPPGAG
jgi:hypothetical protein